jgi:hypothetical protein
LHIHCDGSTFRDDDESSVSICIKLLWYQKNSKEPSVFSAASAKVMSGALLGPTGYKATKDNVVSLQMSPDLIGSPFYPNNEPGP